MSKDQTTCEVCGGPYFHWVDGIDTTSLVCTTCGAEEGTFPLLPRNPAKRDA